MENASKALLMAGGILIGVLILALMVTLFISARDLFNNYEETKETEAIQQFNVNFTQYLGRDLTIHEVVTICNFAKKHNVDITGEKTSEDIKDIVALYTNQVGSIHKYTLTINSYSTEGYVNAISFN